MANYNGQSFWVLFLFFNICSVTCFYRSKNSGNTYQENNPDVLLNSFQLIQKYNYYGEEHFVVTKNGYQLKIFRIPKKGPPVLLVHGIGDSSDSWLVLGPQHSLAYLLADTGFDVWLFNARGNRYSKTHIKTLSRRLYWDFSYEEIGSEDMPATIDYILSKTRHSKLTYIGFSQGTTVFFVMCSMLPEYNSLINYAILLAPVAWTKNIKYPFIDFFSRNLNDLISFDKKEKIYEVFPFNKNLNIYHSSVCKVNSPFKLLCQLELYLNFGLKTFTNLLPDRLPVITSHIPAGSSSKTFFHFIQGYGTKRFQRYDYGKEKNREVYASSLPPEYNVSLITIPMTLFVSEVDWFSDTNDVEILRNRLKTVDKYVVINESLQFTHLEFVYGSRVNTIINKPVINILKTLTNI
ncbi:unnamed protein product [Euphydryas editha]|uniref:Lipase n=1 Tax=Euphydryas editha TaxID=104508 RepID=A0AAU9V653_EUPED|nr:unnamed protein product [Euphydryas editha]